MITATVEQKSLQRYLKTLDKNRGKPLHMRAQRTIYAASRRRIVPALKANAPKGTQKKNHTRAANGLVKRRRKTMRGSASSKLLRKRGGEDFRPTWVGYKAFHAHMVIGGTDTHPLGTSIGQRSNRRHLGAGGRNAAGQYLKHGIWKQRRGGGIANWRSGFAHFDNPDPKRRVRPLSDITVRGVTPNDVVDRTWRGAEHTVVNDISRDVFAVK